MMPKFKSLYPATGSAIFAPLPPSQDAVAGVLSEGSISIFLGPAGGAKTWLAYYLALSAASGLPFLGLDAAAHEVLVLDYEMGEQNARRRFRELAAGADIEPPANLYAVFLPEVYLPSAELFADLELLNPKTLVVIDSLAAASPGVDENHASVRAGLDRLRRIAHRNGATFVVIHHTGKGNDIRGSSAIAQAVDEIFYIKVTDPDAKIYEVETTKMRLRKEPWRQKFQLIDINGGVKVELASSKVDLPESASRPLPGLRNNASVTARAGDIKFPPKAKQSSSQPPSLFLPGTPVSSLKAGHVSGSGNASPISPPVPKGTGAGNAIDPASNSDVLVSTPERVSRYYSSGLVNRPNSVPLKIAHDDDNVIVAAGEEEGESVMKWESL